MIILGTSWFVRGGKEREFDWSDDINKCESLFFRVRALQGGSDAVRTIHKLGTHRTGYQFGLEVIQKQKLAHVSKNRD